MKKFFVILLTALIGLFCFACVDNDTKPNYTPVKMAFDTIIQDSDGVDKCFWEDGKAMFDDTFNSGSQKQKSAVLTTQTEYDMWFALNRRVLELSNEEFYYPTEFEYDETKIEIKANPNEESHFILRALQPCNKEQIIIKITGRSVLDDDVDENGEPLHIPTTQRVTITVSTTE